MGHECMSLILSQAEDSWTPRQTLDLEERFKESVLFCPAEFRDERIDAAPAAQLRQDELLDLSDLRPQPEGTTALVPTRERSSRSAAGQTASRVAPDVPVADHPLASLRPASSAGPSVRRYEMIYRNYAPTGPPVEIVGPPLLLPAHTVLLRVALFDKKVKRQEWIVHGKQTLLEVCPAHQALFSSCAHSLPLVPQLRNVLDCLTSTELKFQGDLLTKHDATEQHERASKGAPDLAARLRPSARSPRAAAIRRALQAPRCPPAPNIRADVIHQAAAAF